MQCYGITRSTTITNPGGQKVYADSWQTSSVDSFFHLKARVSLARAAYSEADIVLLDDPISAVDAYVGRAILDECLLTGPLANRTRILVTHALHVLHKTDYIYVMDNGIITEEGTYQVVLNFFALSLASYNYPRRY